MEVRARSETRKATIGFQRVDNLYPSKYLIELVQTNLDDDWSYS